MPRRSVKPQAPLQAPALPLAPIEPSAQLRQCSGCGLLYADAIAHLQSFGHRP